MSSHSRRPLIGSLAGVLACAALTACAPTDWVDDGLKSASCNDGTSNGDETDVDCGGTSCKQCVIGDGCLASSDCASGDCTDGTCREPHCSNLTQDPNEEGLDCGGTDCKPCGSNDQCSNGNQDEGETDVDCGGLSSCDRCKNGDSCTADGDCLSKRCNALLCAANTGGVGGATGEGGAGNEGGRSEGGTPGSGGQGAQEAGAPNGGTGGDSSSSAGRSSSGGVSMGGAEPGVAGASETGGDQNTGGQSTRGGTTADEGGTDSGGGTQQTGGASTGGKATGGTSTGGKATGGTSTGGTSTGGAATGGTSTGGTSTGGTSSGGTSTGGTSTGGTATGGTDPCSPRAAPSDGLLTDFSEFTTGSTWTTGEEPWGDANLSGTTFTYGSTGTVLTATITSGGALQLSSTLSNNNFEGLGFQFDPAVDASSFAGLSFTVSGNLGNATLEIQLRTIRNLPDSETCGTCVPASEETKWDDCVFNAKSVSVTGSPQSIPWTDFTGGKPITSSNASELLGVQIQFECGQSAGCGLDVTFDDFAFYE